MDLDTDMTKRAGSLTTTTLMVEAGWKPAEFYYASRLMSAALIGGADEAAAAARAREKLPSMTEEMAAFVLARIQAASDLKPSRPASRARNHRSTERTPTARGASMIETIGLEKIRPSEDNLRRNLGDIDGMAATIAEIGLLQKPLVCPAGDGTYRIVAGHRRLAAIKQLGWTEVQVEVREVDDLVRLQAMLVENLHREGLAPLEEADGYRRLADLGMTQADIARKTSTSQANVSKKVSLLDLPAKVAKLVDSGGISVVDALELTKLNAWPDRLESALRMGQQYGRFANYVAGELEAQGLADKRAELEAKLRARKVKVIDLAGSTTWQLCDQRGFALLGPHSGYGPSLDMGVREHAKLACHAALVDGRGDTRYLCTKPKSHGSAAQQKNASSADAKAKAESARQRAHNRELKLAAGGRFVRMQRLVKGRVRPGTASVFAVAQLLRCCDDRLVAYALDLLGLEHPDVHNGYSTDTPSKRILCAHAERGDAFAHSALLALGLAVTEWEMKRGQWPARVSGRHFAFLAEHGYTAGDAETAQLASVVDR
jgi:ParB/RepB/Spo0J family partition protein